MDANEGKAGFARRLNQAFDSLDIPPKQRGRFTAIARLFSVSPVAARDWCEGNSYPSVDKLLLIMDTVRCGADWLLFGRPPALAQGAGAAAGHAAAAQGGGPVPQPSTPVASGLAPASTDPAVGGPVPDTGAIQAATAAHPDPAAFPEQPGAPGGLGRPAGLADRWSAAVAGAGHGGLRWWPVTGDSMRPSLQPGDWFTLEEGPGPGWVDGIYALTTATAGAVPGDGVLLLRRLVLGVDGHLVMRCDNPLAALAEGCWQRNGADLQELLPVLSGPAGAPPLTGGLAAAPARLRIAGRVVRFQRRADA